MNCTSKGYKAFLVCCNVALLFIGASVLILGVKMLHIMSVMLMIDMPQVSQVIHAVITTGFFISSAGITGITGACCESLKLIAVHLFTLAAIVIMQFSLGVTLLAIKGSIEHYAVSEDCNQYCAATLDSLVLDYALPSAGLMMTIIIVEAFMVYSAIRMFFDIRDKIPKVVQPTSPIFGEAPHINTTYSVDNAHRQNVLSPQSGYELSPRQMHSPRMDYLFALPHISSTSTPNSRETDPPSYTEASRIATPALDYTSSIIV